VLDGEREAVAARYADRFEPVRTRTHEEGIDRWVALTLRRRP
jgi:hypothetical protein